DWSVDVRNSTGIAHSLPAPSSKQNEPGRALEMNERSDSSSNRRGPPFRPVSLTHGTLASFSTSQSTLRGSTVMLPSLPQPWLTITSLPPVTVRGRDAALATGQGYTSETVAYVRGCGDLTAA